MENAGGTAQKVAIEMFDTSGQALSSWPVNLPAYAQQHFSVSALMQTGQAAMVRVTPQIAGSAIAQVVTYQRAGDVRLLALYPVPLREAFGLNAVGSFNLFLGMENAMQLSNPSAQIAHLTVRLNGPLGNGQIGVLSTNSVVIPARGSAVLQLHDASRFNTRADIYGTVVIDGLEQGAFVADVVRRKSSATELEFLMPTTAR